MQKLHKAHASAQRSHVNMAWGVVVSALAAVGAWVTAKWA